MKDNYKPGTYEFPVRCPRDSTVHQAIVHITKLDTEELFPSFIECHGSSDMEPCRTCIPTMYHSFMADTVPVDFTDPLDPRSLPDWPS